MITSLYDIRFFYVLGFYDPSRSLKDKRGHLQQIMRTKHVTWISREFFQNTCMYGNHNSRSVGEGHLLPRPGDPKLASRRTLTKSGPTTQMRLQMALSDSTACSARERIRLSGFVHLRLRG